jgi:bifunctional DNase/RNase
MTDTISPSQPVTVNIRALVMDPVSKMPVVILQPPERPTFLPIWIGVCEANAIALQLEGVATPRPMTHDLIRGLLEATRYRIRDVLIHTLDDSVFLATIHLEAPDGSLVDVDSRPSDALAVALRTDAPVLVDPAVLEQAEVPETSEEDAVRAVLERLRPEDLGDYEM